MGFSLRHFFDELEHELNTGTILTVVFRLRRLIRERRQYAQECGLLK